MKIIFTKSKLPLSVFIRWGLKEPVSHVALVFDEKIVFHSNLTGVHVEWYHSFKKHCTIVYEIEVPLTLEQEEEVYRSVIDVCIGKSYDFKAFGYFIWRALLWRCLNKPMPAKNKWQGNKSYICTGFVGKLPHSLLPALDRIQDTEMVSPYKLFSALSEVITPTSDNIEP